MTLVLAIRILPADIIRIIFMYSRNGGTIDGLQIEAYRIGLRDTPANRAFHAQSMTEVLDEYLREHYGWME